MWKRLPQGWGESAFVGNGRIGATIDVQEGALGWTINRTDVVHQQSRFPVGRVLLKTAGAVRGGTARLTLWDAEASGTVTTDSGEVRWRSFVSAAPSVIVIVLDARGREAAAADLGWAPAQARPPRKLARRDSLLPEDLHPDAAVAAGPDGITSVQRFIGGGAHAESIRRAASGSGSAGERIYYVSIEPAGDTAAARAAAQATTAAAARQGLTTLAAGHRAWWHAYYPASFLSFPDARLESYYWIQVYKLGSAMREDGPILDLNGPWFRHTPWPMIWWNLNIQLTYSPLFRANRLGLAESLFGNLDRNRQALIENVPERLRGEAAAVGRTSGQDLVRPVDLATAESDAAKEMGNLPWTMYYYWLHYRYQMDDAVLRDRVYPLLKRAIGNYLAYVEKGADGRWHLPPTHSPELATVPDANYDLALLRWGLETLIASAARLRLNEPMLPRWRDVLANLTPFPTDTAGLMVGRGRPWKESHRHYSHLLAIYPLGLITPETPGGRDLIVRSLRAWEREPGLFRGYSFTGGAAMHALLGHGDSALARMNAYLDAPRYMEPNTFYAESGPVIETPLAAAATLQDLFLQDWGGALRVFPAVPGAWRDAAFDRFRADGAYLVSAVRRGGRTAWVRVESLAGGGPRRIVVPDWRGAVVRSHGGGAAPRLTRSEDGDFVLDLDRGAWAVLAPSATAPLPDLSPVPLPPAQHNLWPMFRSSDAAPRAPERPQDRTDLAWWRESMQTRDRRLAWWREARFGMFIHWGVYSTLAGMWDGRPVPGYAEHIQRIRRIPAALYRDSAVARFNPVRFDADAWVAAAQGAGMGYMIITAKHHDGFAMYDSKVSDYDVVDATPFRRDPLRELRDAARRRGLRFGFYYSHAFDWGDPEAPGNDWEYENPGGDRNLHGGREWWVESPQSPTGPDRLAKARRYVDRKAIPQVVELIRRYDPDILWFDTPHKLPPDENLRILRAAREAKPDLVINGRGVQPLPGGPEARFGDYANTADRPAELTRPEGDWEAIPTTNESYGYHRADSSHKPPEHFVRLLSKAAARGGNLLLNVGPMGDGRFDPRDSVILAGVGRWAAVNGEAIRGTTRTPLPVQAWGQSSRKGSRIYLHVHDWPRGASPSDRRLHVAGLSARVTRAWLLAAPGAPGLAVRGIGPRDAEIELPPDPPDPWVSVIALEVDGPVAPDSAIYLGPRAAPNGSPVTLHVFDGRLTGPGIRYGDGKRGRDVTLGWDRLESGVEWSVRVGAPAGARFRVAADYAAPSPQHTGAFEITVGGQRITSRVTPTGGDTLFATRVAGEVALAPGEYTLRVRPTEVAGGELMRLRRLELTPLPASGPRPPPPSSPSSPSSVERAAAPAAQADAVLSRRELVRLERARVLAAARRYLREPPVTVTAYRAERSAGGRHDFYSEGDYWWPDPKNPEGPYIRRDGETNPANFVAHRDAMRRLSQIVPALVAAYQITGDARYARQAVAHLRAWFAAAGTRMNPNLMYGQAIKGVATGRGIGIIDTIHLVEVARAAAVLERVGRLRGAELAGVKDWFREYLQWMTTHPFGIAERDNGNNHSAAWALQVAAFARLVGDSARLASTRAFFKETLVPQQMAADGSFPKELARTKPYGYSLFQLDVMAMVAETLSTPADDLWRYTTPDGRGMRQALAFMYPYILDKRRWPKPPDVMYHDEWPVRHPALLFGGRALGEPRYVALWKTLPADPTVDEVVRNYPVRQPLLWVDQ